MLQNLLKEVGTKENFVSNEINKKFSPIDLLSKSKELGISGDDSEIMGMKALIRKETDIKLEQEKIKEQSKFSDGVNEYITTQEELELYENEGLEESEVNGKPALIDNDIDPDLKDDKGRTNLERMEQGHAPKDENGKSYNLHHIGQKSDSPLAELKNSTHKENDDILHDKTEATEVHGPEDRAKWNKERSDYWKARAEQIKEQRSQNV